MGWVLGWLYLENLSEELLGGELVERGTALGPGVIHGHKMRYLHAWRRGVGWCGTLGVNLYTDFIQVCLVNPHPQAKGWAPLALSQRCELSTSSQEEDRYLQCSKLPTMHFQPGLLRLPIPKIEDTCARYLAALEPVAPSPEAFSKTQELVRDFQRSGGMGHGKWPSVVWYLLGVSMCVCAQCCKGS